MKKIYILSAMMLTLVSVSCKKSFIDLDPQDSLSPNTFFKNESQMRQALAAAYAPLHDLAVNDYFTSEMRSDNTHYQPYPSNVGTAYVQRESISDWLDDPTNAYTNAVYFHCYNGISRSNIVLDHIDNATLSPAAKNDIEGQAKFLRAWNYFKLVRLFGAVPLYLKEVSKADDAFLARATVDQVYTQIITDAKDAIIELTVPKFPQSGQATKGSATMLLAEVYMTQKKYIDAEQLLNSLTTMGYALNANYADAFLTTNKNSKESIFEIQYLQGTDGGSQPSTFIYQFLPRTKNTGIITTFGATVIATDNSGTGGWNTPSPDLISAYEPNDKRLDASIGIAEGTYNTSDLFAVTANKSIINYTPAAGQLGVPYIKKYLHPHSIVNNTDDNWPIYRYSDALLLLAESENEQGNAGQALTNLNVVRVRAGLAVCTESSQAKLRDVIMHERRVELAFENHRWNDLVRTGNAIKVMTTYAIMAKRTYKDLPSNAFSININRLLFPIPQSEREINPQLTQNPGYF
ncbi:RagB/SusD family nutrient uptake outer membrane protein [Mucilaginibacter aquaedulcis]|uniref:RagB/SusD family nutrient uptake outer membrane protein n=1 Tax=Mucilaginibacter aquaedulcis TaxID=1187081 RepID=UPI0025B546BD|nr:RagB/SusD family nutrient uptake outer membrane protein [Mucilaginibacter aquaedulcis]MDN3548803.1 RagB/SusD family nutrient uptake outer membrane protein [Mucilaginibacter aquaedulcis]